MLGVYFHFKCLVSAAESQTPTTYADFFDSSFTFFNESIQVRCCSPDLTLTNVTCGQGTSCIGQCSAIGASLCLSENCTADPDDCNISLESEKRKKRNAGTCKACQSSQKLRKCAPSCRVKRKPACCFHPVCYEKRPNYCSNTNYFSGIPFYIDSLTKLIPRKFLPQTWQHSQWKVELPNPGVAPARCNFLGWKCQHLSR